MKKNEFNSLKVISAVFLVLGTAGLMTSLTGMFLGTRMPLAGAPAIINHLLTVAAGILGLQALRDRRKISLCLMMGVALLVSAAASSVSAGFAIRTMAADYGIGCNIISAVLTMIFPAVYLYGAGKKAV